MSRNGSGVYSVPNTFTAGQPIVAADHNENWSDIGTEITNSVAADGQTSMTGALKASAGSAAAPSMTFAADPDTGIYRIAGNNLGVAVAGAKVLDVSSSGLGVTGDLAASGAVKQNGFALIPVGFGPVPWSGLTAPSGWVLTGTTPLLRASYPALWAFAEAEIAGGNSFYGNGNGTTTFTIGDMSGRVPAGRESSASRLTATYFGGNSTTIGATGGSELNNVILTHTHIADAVADHRHFTVAGNDVNNSLSAANRLAYRLTGASDASYTLGGQSDDASIGLTSLGGAHTPTIQNAGSASAHNIVQPTIILNYIIFAGV